MAVKRQGGLGRGLDALFSDSSIMDEVSVEADASEKVDDISSDGISYLNIDEIIPNASQPRKNFNEEAIDELADSIKRYGLIQPIIVRKSNDRFEIVAGERRWRAARRIDLKSVPCIVKELSDRENMLLAIIENTQREDLDPIEEASAFQAMIEQYQLTQEEVSRSVGKSRPYITNALRLLKLPDSVRAMVTGGRLSAGHARAIAGIDDPVRQEKLAAIVVNNGLSVRSLEQLIASSPEKKGKKESKSHTKSKSPDIISIENELKTILGTKVSLPADTNKGKIEISFYSQDELERLIEMLKALKSLY